MSNLCAFRDFGRQQRYARFCGRVVVLSILSLLLYPFLWAWTVIGTLWFRRAKDCVSFSCYWCSSIIRGNIIWQWLVYEANAPNACSCLKKVRNGVSSFGCFLATVDFFALLACPWGRLVALFVPLHFLDFNNDLALYHEWDLSFLFHFSYFTSPILSGLLPTLFGNIASWCFLFLACAVLILVEHLLCSGWQEDRHTYYALNKGFLYLNMG